MGGPQDVALVEAAKGIVTCDAAIDDLYRLYGDDYEDREDRQVWEARRDSSIAVLANRPATSIEGLRAKAAAMQIRTIAEASEYHGVIGQSLAEDILDEVIPGFVPMSRSVYADDVKLVELNAKMLDLYARESAAYAETDRCLEMGLEEAGLDAEDRRDDIFQKKCAVYDQMLTFTPRSMEGCRALAMGIIYTFHGDKIVSDGINGEGPEGEGLCILLQALTGLSTRTEVLTPDESAA